MVDLKRTAADKKAEQEKYDASPIGDCDDYPYGLRICLDSATLKKLSLKPLKVGGRVAISGFADVVSVSMSDGAHGESCGMDLQITDLDASPIDAKSATAAFYGDDDGGL